MIHVVLPSASRPPGAGYVAGDGDPPPETAASNGTILVVDDDQDILELLRYALEGEHYTVLCASGGNAALEVLRSAHQVSLILLDLMMPGMNGWRFAEELSRLYGRESPPVVVLSASTSHANPPGIAGFLRKPIDLKQLIDAVARYRSKPDDRC